MEWTGLPWRGSSSPSTSRRRANPTQAARGPWPCVSISVSSSSCLLSSMRGYVRVHAASCLSLIDLQFGDPYTSYYYTRMHAYRRRRRTLFISCARCSMECTSHAACRPSLCSICRSVKESGNACTVTNQGPMSLSQGHGLHYTPTVYPHLM